MQDYFNRELERQGQAAQHRIAEAEHEAVLQQQQINMQMGGGAMLDGGDGALRAARSTCPTFGSKDKDEDKKLSAKDFMLWQRAVNLWASSCRVPRRSLGVHAANSLSGLARETVLLDVAVDDLATNQGVAKIMARLEPMYFGDRINYTINATLEFLSLRRGASMDDYVQQFRIGVEQLKVLGHRFQDELLSCMLLKGAGLTDTERALLLASTGRNLDSSTIAETLRNLFRKTPVRDSAMVVEDSESAMYANNANNKSRAPRKHSLPPRRRGATSVAATGTRRPSVPRPVPRFGGSATAADSLAT